MFPRVKKFKGKENLPTWNTRLSCLYNDVNRDERWELLPNIDCQNYFKNLDPLWKSEDTSTSMHIRIGNVTNIAEIYLAFRAAPF